MDRGRFGPRGGRKKALFRPPPEKRRNTRSKPEVQDLNNDTMCCGGGCHSGCGGCSGALELTQAELGLLRRFAQLPFLPVARRGDSEVPVCLEDGTEAAEALSAAITGLHQKRLIRLDYDLPLSNFDYGAYGQYPYRGSMALTARGQAAVELLDIQGVEDPA